MLHHRWPSLQHRGIARLEQFATCCTVVCITSSVPTEFEDWAVFQIPCQYCLITIAEPQCDGFMCLTQKLQRLSAGRPCSRLTKCRRNSVIIIIIIIIIISLVASSAGGLMRLYGSFWHIFTAYVQKRHKCHFLSSNFAPPLYLACPKTYYMYVKYM